MSLEPASSRHFVFMVSVLLLVSLDLWSKDACFAALDREASGEILVWEGVLRFRQVLNPGMMWGMAQDVSAAWWVVIRGIVLLALCWLYFSLPRHSVFTQIAFGLVAAGAIGNIADNIFQGEELFEGHVRDFIHFYWFEFPTFNVADSCISVGAPLMLFILWKNDRKVVRKGDSPG